MRITRTTPVISSKCEGCCELIFRLVLEKTQMQRDRTHRMIEEKLSAFQKTGHLAYDVLYPESCDMCVVARKYEVEIEAFMLATTIEPIEEAPEIEENIIALEMELGENCWSVDHVMQEIFQD